MTRCGGPILLIAGPFLVIYGLVSIINPEAAWSFDQLFRSWAYRGQPEPSHTRLIVQRILGVFCILLAIGATVLYIHYRPT